MALPALLGQDLILSRLCDLVKAGRLPHALLFVDREEIAMGIALAEHLAGYMHCKNRGERMCGECVSCQQIINHNHPDLHYVFPEINLEDKSKNADSVWKKWRNFLQANPYPQYIDWLQELGGTSVKGKQGNINKKACDTLLMEAQLSNSTQGGKIFVIWLAELLGNEGNRLLKVIEEPEPNTFFFLITYSQELILSTLRSRVQTVFLRPIAEPDILNYLTQSLQLPSEKAKEIILQAGTNMADISQLLRDENGQSLAILRLFLNACFANSPKRMAVLQDFLQTIAKLSREEVKDFLGYVMNIFAQALRANFLPNNYSENILKIKNMMPVEALEQFLQLLSDYHYYVLRNADIKLTLHSLILQCRMILQQGRWIAVAE